MVRFKHKLVLFVLYCAIPQSTSTTTITKMTSMGPSHASSDVRCLTISPPHTHLWVTNSLQPWLNGYMKKKIKRTKQKNNNDKKNKTAPENIWKK